MSEPGRPLTDRSDVETFDPTTWQSFHLYYHGDQDAVLTERVVPLVRALVVEGAIERFFYLRYRLGGPHLRLRFRPRQGARETVETAVAAMAETLFRQAPSRDSLDPEAIARGNESILRLDPNESDATVYPDNSYHAAPFVPEVERFGGPGTFEHCLDAFTASSLGTLDFLRACRPSEGPTPSPNQRLAATLQRQAVLAWALASDLDQWQLLVGYAGQFPPEPMAAIAERGDATFEQNRDAFVALVRQALERAAETELPSGEPEPATAAELEQATLRQLATLLDRHEPDRRLRILTSQLHLGANRLGQSNPDEIYLGRMLWRSARALVEDHPEQRDRLAERLASRASAEPGSPGSLDRLAGACLERFADLS